MMNIKTASGWVQVDGNFRSQVEEKSKAQFPQEGNATTLYVATDENKIYYWNGSKYVVLGAGDINYQLSKSCVISCQNTTTFSQIISAIKNDTTGIKTCHINYRKDEGIFAPTTSFTRLNITQEIKDGKWDSLASTLLIVNSAFNSQDQQLFTQTDGEKVIIAYEDFGAYAGKYELYVTAFFAIGIGITQRRFYPYFNDGDTIDVMEAGIPARWVKMTLGSTSILANAYDTIKYTAGNGIDITSNEISVDTEVVATQTDLASYRTSAEQDVIDATKQAALGFTPENVANKVSAWQQTPDNTHYASEKLVKDALDDKQAQINNLKSLDRYMSDWNSRTGLPTTNPPQSPYTYQTGAYFLVSVIAEEGGTNYKPDGATYTTGVASTVVETNEVAVGDRYYFDGATWTLLKTQVDYSAFAQKAGNNTFTGTNTFSGDLKTDAIKDTSNNTMLDFSNGKIDAGSNDIKTTGKYTDGTNEFTAKQVADGTINVINASEIVNNTLTQAQYDLMLNGKPTIIKGTWNTYINPIVSTISDFLTEFTARIEDANKTDQIVCNATNRVITFRNNGSKVFELRSILKINGKEIPVYPSSPAVSQVLTYGTNDALSWTNKEEGNYELISDETLTEDVDRYDKTFDYDYKKVLVNIKHPKITSPLSRTLNVAGSIRFQMVLSDVYVNHFWISIENKNGRIFSDCRCSINSDANANSQVTYSANAIGGIETNSNFHNLSMVFIGNQFLSGTIIKIYGVRA